MSLLDDLLADTMAKYGANPVDAGLQPSDQPFPGMTYADQVLLGGFPVSTDRTLQEEMEGRFEAAESLANNAYMVLSQIQSLVPPEQQADATAEFLRTSGFSSDVVTQMLGIPKAEVNAALRAAGYDALGNTLTPTGFDDLNGSGEGEIEFTPASFQGAYDAAKNGFEIDGVFYPYSGVSSTGVDGSLINVVDGGTYKLVTQQDGSVSVEAVVGGAPKRNTDALPKVDGDYSFDDIMKVVGLINAGAYTVQQIADIYGLDPKEVQGIVDNPPPPPGTDPGAGTPPGGTPPGGTPPGTDPNTGGGTSSTNPCDDPAYAAANPTECGLTPPTNPCDDPEYAAANPTECGLTPPPNPCDDPEYAAANPIECGLTPPDDPPLNGENDDLDIDLNIIPGLIAGTLLPEVKKEDPDPVVQPPLPVPVGGVPADPGFVTRDDVLVEFDAPDYDPYSILPAPTTEPFLADRRAGDIASSLDVLGFRPSQGLDQRPETVARVEDYAQRFGVGPQDFSQDAITPFETQFGLDIPNVSTNFPVRPESILETPRFDPTKPRDTEEDGDMRLFASGGVAEATDGIGSLMKRREGAVTRMLLNKAGALPTYQDGGKVTVENDDRNRVTSLLKSTTEVPAGLRDAAGYAYDYLTETPVSEMMGEVREMGAGMVRSAMDDPVDFALDFIPGVSQARGLAEYEEMMSQAELARIMGDEETADALRAMASTMLASSMIPGGRRVSKMGMSDKTPSFEELMEQIRKARETGEKTLKDLERARRSIEGPPPSAKGIGSLDEKLNNLQATIRRNSQQGGRTRGQAIEESSNVTRRDKRTDSYDPENN